MNFDVFKIVVVIMIIITAALILCGFVAFFSPKIRGKMMSRNIKATKYMMDESKDDIKSISTDMAEATSDAVEITTRSIKKGLSEDASIFCKYCGAKIDKDSKFCNKCGKEL